MFRAFAARKSPCSQASAPTTTPAWRKAICPAYLTASWKPSPARPVNLARFRFLDPAARDFYPDFADSANTTVALLRTEAGRDPFSKSLTDLIGELSTRSEEFRAMWAAHNVRLHRSGLKRFHHPVIGRIDLMFEALALEADDGLTLTAYAAEPGTPSHDALRLLASWAATSMSETNCPGRPSYRMDGREDQTVARSS